jgi:alpha-beta hydrolase superfamily lysophospholipase
MNARPITFRFGLTGRRWGERGPVVLLVHGAERAPATFAQLADPLVASGRQVILLDDPTGAGPDGADRVTEFALAIGEAAVEIRELEAVVGHALGAAAVALALKQGLPAERAVLIAADPRVDPAAGIPVLLAPESTRREPILDFLNGRTPLRLAA